jgi:hypothetical protein
MKACKRENEMVQTTLDARPTARRRLRRSVQGPTSESCAASAVPVHEQNSGRGPSESESAAAPHGTGPPCALERAACALEVACNPYGSNLNVSIQIPSPSPDPLLP